MFAEWLNSAKKFTGLSIKLQDNLMKTIKRNAPNSFETHGSLTYELWRHKHNNLKFYLVFYIFSVTQFYK